MTRRIEWSLWGLAGYGALLYVVHLMCWYRPRCVQPCADLGHEDFAGPRDKNLYKPKCAPLRLDYEIRDPGVHVGHFYTLFYRFSLTNVSCYRLTLGGSQILYNETFSPYEFALIITDPDGNVINPEHGRVNTGMFPDDTEYGVDAPYRNDAAQAEKLRSKFGIKDVTIIHLDPGQSVSSVGSVFKPYTIRPWAEGTNHGSIDGHIWIPSTGTVSAPIPPPGFRVLDQFVFKKPGVYRVQARWNEEVHAETVYPLERWADVVWPITAPFSFFTGIRLDPPFEQRYSQYQVDITAPSQEFRVLR